jgi:hypothetical protein
MHAQCEANMNYALLRKMPTTVTKFLLTHTKKPLWNRQRIEDRQNEFYSVLHTFHILVTTPRLLNSPPRGLHVGRQYQSPKMKVNASLRTATEFG